MTLLEALVALVILAMASLGLLGAFQGATRATRDAAAWVHTVGLAEAAMEHSKLGPMPGSGPAVLDVGAVIVRVEPGPADGVERITVTVPLPDGGAFVLHRLAPVR